MRKCFFSAASLALAGCSGSGVTYLNCVVGDQTDKLWRFKLDEKHGRFDLKTGDLPSMTGKAEFMAQDVRLTGDYGQAVWFINRNDLSWGQFGGPPDGHCVKADAPFQQF